jgi:hypothetical protein
VSPANASIGGNDASDSLFSIKTDVTLLSLLAAAIPAGGIEVSWATDPGPADLRGYRLERDGSGGGDGWTTIAPLVTGTRYVDASGAPGSSYRLYSVNGFGEELLLGETSVRPMVPLAAWPTPYRGHGDMLITFATSSGVGGGVRPAEVMLYDVSGRLVRRIATGDLPAGYHRTAWDGRDARGAAVASGVYFLVSRSAGEERRLKLVVAR